MKTDRPIMRWIAALVVIGVVAGGILSAAPLGAVAQDGGVETPTPQPDGDYNCDDFETVEQLRAVYDPDVNQYGLDKPNDQESDDPDKIACESRFPNQEPYTTETTTPTSTETATTTETTTETATTTETETQTTTPEETTTTTETATTETETTEAEAEQPTASVTFDNQSSDGTTVVVKSVTMSEGGFVAIHNASGPVIGVSEYLTAGTHENVEITLFDVLGQDFAEGMSLEEDQTLIAMPHLDTNGNDEYEFVSSGGSEDGPYTEDGGAVVDPASVTIKHEMGTDEGEAAEGNDLGQNDKDDDGDGHVDEDDEDPNDFPSNDDDDGDGAIDEDDEPDDGDDGSDDFNGNAEDDDDGDGHFDEDDEEDGGNSDDEDNDGDGAVDEDDEPDNDD